MKLQLSNNNWLPRDKKEFHYKRNELLQNVTWTFENLEKRVSVQFQENFQLELK